MPPGRLTADPEPRSLRDGRSVCDLRVAVNDQRDKSPRRGSGRNQVPSGEGYIWGNGFASRVG
jgi:single-stranded DNA-binding protein